MKNILVTIVIVIVVIGITIIYTLYGEEPSQTYRGTVTGTLEDNLVVEFIIPASADELIGLEAGDPYVIEGVHK